MRVHRKWIVSIIVVTASVAVLAALWLAPARSRSVQENTMVGRAEEAVRAAYGVPTQVRIGSSSELLNGELAFSIRKFVRNDERVKEIYYRLNSGGERLFWLVRRDTNLWTVVADIYIPRGVIY